MTPNRVTSLRWGEKHRKEVCGKVPNGARLNAASPPSSASCICFSVFSSFSAARFFCSSALSSQDSLAAEAMEANAAASGSNSGIMVRFRSEEESEIIGGFSYSWVGLSQEQRQIDATGTIVWKCPQKTTVKDGEGA